MSSAPDKPSVDFSNFCRVDDQPDATPFVAHMDAMRAWPLMPQQKRQSIDELRLGTGSWALDVGCGTGDDVLAMARLIGTTGRAVGVDLSDEMIAASVERASATQLATEFKQGNAYQLPFEADTFHGTRSERLFEHLENPREALAELVRVTRHGGRVVVISTDADGYMFELPDRELLRKVIHHGCDRRGNGWAGRQLYGLFSAAGLDDVQCVVYTHVLTDVNLVCPYLEARVAEAHADGAITAEQRTIAQTSLAEARERGVTLFCTPHFMVSGTKR